MDMHNEHVQHDVNNVARGQYSWDDERTWYNKWESFPTQNQTRNHELQSVQHPLTILTTITTFTGGAREALAQIAMAMTAMVVVVVVGDIAVAVVIRGVIG